jgi:hypothetical protein
MEAERLLQENGSISSALVFLYGNHPRNLRAPGGTGKTQSNATPADPPRTERAFKQENRPRFFARFLGY